jgi:hypothetical protein
MNLVDFDSETRNLIVSNQFWLYFMVSVPLTAVTLACWQYRMQAYRKGYATGDTNPTEKKTSAKTGVDIEIV